MASVLLEKPRNGVWRFSRRDSVLVSLTALHAAVLVAWPIAPVIGLGVWWNSNTIAHNFIHRPFFRSATINRLFSAALSVLLGIPQTLWRERHLAHHAEVSWRLRVSRQLVIERSEEHTSELQSQFHLVCRLLLEKKKEQTYHDHYYTYV